MMRLLSYHFKLVRISALFIVALFLVTSVSVDARNSVGVKFKRTGPAAAGSVGMHPQRYRFSDTRYQRNIYNDNRREHREDYRDHREERYDNRRDNRGDANEERRDERYERHEDQWKRRTGTVLSISAFSQLSCRTSVVFVYNVKYYQCGDTWYKRGSQVGRTVYVVVDAPQGY